MVELRLQAELKQTLELLLAPRLIQMLKVLQLPYLEAVEAVSREAEENVLLDVERQDEYVEFLRFLTSDRKIKQEADFSELPGLKNIGRTEKTLEAHLLDQLEMADLEDQQKEIAREMIGNIDDHGYLLAYPRLREQIMAQFDLSRPTVDKVLRIIQGFEPEGVGARDLRECLLLQIEAYDFENDELAALLTQVVSHHLEAVDSQNAKKLAASLEIPESGAGEIINFIKNNLNPYPGASFGQATCHVIPSFAVEATAKGFTVVNLEKRYGPIMRLSPHYLKLLDDPKTDEKTKEYLREKLKKARELMEDFAKRSETLAKIARKIIDSQPEFLAKGAIWLKPLTQKSLADEFGLHPSTISRTVSGKYVQTPQGLFPLRFLCPRGPKGLTAARLKALLTEVIAGEDKTRPMSDEEVTKILLTRGAQINRRTTAYYRQELKIPNAAERSEQK